MKQTPSHINERIASLRNLIRQGLHQSNLDKIVAECNSLAQDTSPALTFFTLKCVFAEMSNALESGAVSEAEFGDLEAQIADLSQPLLEKILNGQQIEMAELEALVSTHLRNLNIFRSGR